MKDKLNPAWIKFATRYFKTKAVGPSYQFAYPNSSITAAYSSGAELLKKPIIQAYLEEMANDMKRRAVISRESVLEELDKIARFEISDIMDEKGGMLPVHLWGPEARASISSIEVEEIFAGRGAARIKVGELKKVKLHSKISALDSIRDTLGYKAVTQIQNDQTIIFKETKNYESKDKDSTEGK